MDKRVLWSPKTNLERDIGLAPPPQSYQLKDELPLTEAGGIAYTGETLGIMFYITVTYPDRGKTTVYHFKGEARKSLNSLDEVESDWSQQK